MTRLPPSWARSSRHKVTPTTASEAPQLSNRVADVSCFALSMRRG